MEGCSPCCMASCEVASRCVVRERCVTTLLASGEWVCAWAGRWLKHHQCISHGRRNHASGRSFRVDGCVCVHDACVSQRCACLASGCLKHGAQHGSGQSVAAGADASRKPGGRHSRQDRDGCPTHACTLAHACLAFPTHTPADTCARHGAAQHKASGALAPPLHARSSSLGALCLGGHPPTHTPHLSTLHTCATCAYVYAHICIYTCTYMYVCKRYACRHVTDRNAPTPCQLCLQQRRPGPPISCPPECGR